MITVKHASQLVERDIVMLDAFNPSWVWVTRVEGHMNGIVRVYLDHAGYYEDVEAGAFIVVDSSRRNDVDLVASARINHAGALHKLAGDITHKLQSNSIIFSGDCLRAEKLVLEVLERRLKSNTQPDAKPESNAPVTK